MNRVSYMYAIANIAIQDGRKALSIFLPSVQLPSRCLKDLKISFADIFQHNHTLAFLNFCFDCQHVTRNKISQQLVNILCKEA